jgi:hypothetical protein
VVTPLVEWSPIRTNQFNLFGEFSFTNALQPDRPMEFYHLRVP